MKHKKEEVSTPHQEIRKKWYKEMSSSFDIDQEWLLKQTQDWWLTEIEAAEKRGREKGYEECMFNHNLEQ